MKFYSIPPINELDLMYYTESNYFFCLAHLYKQHESYRNFFLNLRKNVNSSFITLDNSAAERSLVTEDILLDVVRELKPDEVIAPDVLFDKDQTIKNLYNFIIKMDNHGYTNHTKIFGCPQGKTKGEWFECYCLMLTNPSVSTIGLSKIAVPKCWNNVEDDKMIAVSRNACVQELYDNNLLTKPLHLLGMGEFNEFEYYKRNNIPNIRSSDSCYTILGALNRISFEDGNTTRIPTTNDYFDQKLNDEQRKLAIKNIRYLTKHYGD